MTLKPAPEVVLDRQMSDRHNHVLSWQCDLRITLASVRSTHCDFSTSKTQRKIF